MGSKASPFKEECVKQEVDSYVTPGRRSRYVSDHDGEGWEWGARWWGRTGGGKDLDQLWGYK